jgi:hypothetical protein
MTRKYRRKGGQPREEMRPPRVFSMEERDIENQMPIREEEMRSRPAPAPAPAELEDIDAPFGEPTFVGPQQKTSVRPLRDDIEAPLQNNPDFSGLGKKSGYGIYDDQFDGGKRRKTRKRSKRSYKKRHTKKRKSNRKK